MSDAQADLLDQMCNARADLVLKLMIITGSREMLHYLFYENLVTQISNESI